MNEVQKYNAAVVIAERWGQKKIQRERDLKLLYAQGGKDEFTIGGLVATDSLVKEYQLLQERAVALASMYGIGAIIETLQAQARR
jgi:hypothetical protein